MQAKRLPAGEPPALPANACLKNRLPPILPNLPQQTRGAACALLLAVVRRAVFHRVGGEGFAAVQNRADQLQQPLERNAERGGGGNGGHLRGGQYV